MRTQHRKALGLAAMLALLLVLGGCSRMPPAPQATATPDATPLAEIAPQLPEEVSSTEVTRIDRRDVSLYFRMQGEEMLACEYRTLWIPKDKQVEMTLIEALIGGPGASRQELVGLFPPGTKVVKVWATDDMLSVLLNRAFLGAPADAPVDWSVDDTWRSEVYRRRRMALASIVNTITEATEYTSVQFLVNDRDDDPTGRRLFLSELYEDADSDQLLVPIMRSEEMLLTHYNTAALILDCWKSQAYERIYSLLAQDGARPVDSAVFAQQMAAQPRRLVRFWLSPGTVSEDGQSAVMELTYEYIAGEGTLLVDNHPLRMVRENGLWKVSHSELSRMMEAI